MSSFIKIIVLFVLLVSSVNAQSISVSPMSTVGISQTSHASETMISYRFVDIHFIHISKKIYNGVIYNHPKLYYGITLSPEFNLKYINGEPIIGYYNNPVTSSYGSKWNFGFSVYKKIFKKTYIYIRHLSNGGVGISNPGIDWLGIRAKF